ncbi:hypothetical protein [Bacillus thuringiensis]|uniref:Uncharacterized protein n=1 Tax=Bacillus thuringiensis TaxID=1428 RepID=A0A9X7BT70_BACTU|nr:hypothetical protein [Bacillus thuringiensis]PES55925.1 hypothetical protein CN499_05735 [Bacillus thuringiensis]PFV35850.1 hypothetical protein COK99_02180 [Bacillus thuringiensis]
MRNYNESDIRFYDTKNETEGDYMVNESGDFALTEQYESARQDITNRMHSQKGEWRSHKWIGADLELLEGEPNTRETGLRGVEQIYQTLTADGRFQVADIDVRAVPTSIEAIEFFAILSTDKKGKVVVKQPLEL